MNEAALDSSASRFGGLSSLARQQWATIGLVLANLIVYIWMGASGVSWTEPDPEHLVSWGANLAPFTLGGESWRLFSSIFVHGGAMHLLLNMYMLLLIGPLAQKRFGGIGFLAVYLATGLVAGLVSAWWYGTHPVTNLFMQSSIRLVASVGASGALMGLAGALCVAGLSDADMGGSQGKALAQVVLLNLGMGFMVSGVDQACHVGGLLAGLPLGALGWSERLKRRPLQRSLLFVALAGAAALGVHQASQALGSEDLSELAAQLRQQQATAPAQP
ncbi:rhomboid family intramembrane serine protease [Chromobacterium rhizoryzae]|uniref:Rhomboid family intramembrane serine protease n=2 Tax=Chromobacterium rhizoryzae TaxID=1778675 RepID=A0AAD0W875_9NEIS|nr:rhomboid family intramembrane serine protease [Chromobacterium rhizoryzae]